MQLRPAIQLQAVIKALKEVIIPAVDPANKLALEQAQLSIGLLALMAQRLPQQFRFDCDELDRLLAFSASLGAHAEGEVVEALRTVTQAAAEVRQRALADPEEVVGAVHQLKAVTGQVVQQTFETGSAAARQQVQTAVLGMSKEQLLRERSWVLMQGWEADPQSVPDIELLLQPESAAAR